VIDNAIEDRDIANGQLTAPAGLVVQNLFQKFQGEINQIHC